MAQPLIIPYIEANHQSIECNFYATMGVNAYAAALASAFTGQFYLTGGLALVGGAAELAYNLAGCGGEPPPPPPSGTDDRFCWQSSTCELIVSRDPPDYPIGVFGDTKALQILDVTTSQETETVALHSVIYIDCNGVQRTLNQTAVGPIGRQFSLNTTNCIGNKPDLPVHSPGEPIAPPQTHTDEDGCNWTIQATDSYVDDSGQWHTYYQITADDPACGGPFGYWSSPTGPVFSPVPPDQPGPPPPPDSYQEKGCCDELKADLAAIKEELDAIKECACGDPKPELLGDWISIRFISDGVSPNGTAPLRKLFRYRSQSSRNEQQLREYWAGFTWQAGPVIVQHKGTWWGTPQVWASSIEEGKRVLRFAAGEAGATPDTDGEWIVTGSASSRYGMPGTMRVQQYRGRDWVIQREGPSGPVEL